jgi:DNA-binding transcriptional MerR regulator
MFGTGAFARIAGVSVRTLHHYDELGLLVPARVDDRTGYRWYEAGQLARLNRIVALRDLGFALQDLPPLLDEQVPVADLRRLLAERRAEAQARMASETARLARVEARLRQIETENQMADYDIIVKPLDALHVAVRGATAAGFDEQLGVILPRLYGELHARLGRIGVTPTGPDVALYEDSDNEAEPIRVIAATPIAPDASVAGLDRRDLPAIPRALTTVYQGSMNQVEDAYLAMIRWADDAGERIIGYGREVYLECDGPLDEWVTELQYVLAPPDTDFVGLMTGGTGGGVR